MPSPEDGLLFVPFPPLIKMPSGPRPPFALLPPLPFPEIVSLDLPGWGPSGEIKTRAERFPAGIAGGGAEGAGVSERAIRVSPSPVRPPMSGATVFVSVLRGAARGEDIGFTGSSGLGGTCEDEAMLIASECFSSAEISGAATFEAASDARVVGLRDVSSFAVSCSLGRSGWEAASCTILGSAGKILGGCRGARG